ncbi:MAG: SLC13 family permease, partial [Thermofilaceae archaeon]
VVKVEEKRVSKASEVIEREVSVLDKMGIEEKMVLLVFLVTLFLWLIPGILSIAASLEPSLSQMATSASRLLPEAAPAALAIVLLGLLRSRKRPLLTFEEIASGIDWNVIFLFGGGIAMGKALDTSGFSKWLALIVINTGIELNPFSLSVIGALVGFAVTFPASNTASAMVSVPLVASIAKGAGLNPTSPIIVTALACSISSAIPSTTPPMAIIYGSKKVDVKNMFKAGIISDVLRLAILALTEPYLVNLLLRLKGLS